MNIGKLILPLLVTITVFGALMQLGGCGKEVAQTIRELPLVEATAEIALDRRSQEAQVTATYIAVLSSEVVSDTAQMHALSRKAEATKTANDLSTDDVEHRAVNNFISVLALSASVVVICAGIHLSSDQIARGIEKVKRARAYEPWQPIPDKAVYYPRLPAFVDARSGVGLLKSGPTAQEQADSVREFRGVVIRSIFSAIADALLNRRSRAWRTVRSSSKEIVVQ